MSQLSISCVAAWETAKGEQGGGDDRLCAMKVLSVFAGWSHFSNRGRVAGGGVLGIDGWVRHCLSVGPKSVHMGDEVQHGRCLACALSFGNMGWK